ncbi:hypothetical protein AB0F91_42330 [Amycolatopsis sp. NPDC023774]|uniref:hypothetical protein n=1 Tax=Amycolatopsis sp. NPDC023774 TaxID=3155015 RepID=UPI0033E1E5AD
MSELPGLPMIPFGGEPVFPSSTMLGLAKALQIWLGSPALLVHGIAQGGQGAVSIVADKVTPPDLKSLATDVPGLQVSPPSRARWARPLVLCWVVHSGSCGPSGC